MDETALQPALTPMMAQYFEIKAVNPGYLLFYRAFARLDTQQLEATRAARAARPELHFHDQPPGSGRLAGRTGRSLRRRRPQRGPGCRR